MRVSNQRVSRTERERGLYLVPRRCLPLVRNLPAGRTLHLVDIENLVGGSDASCMGIRQASGAYREAAPVRAGDHVIVGAGSTLLVPAGLVWSGAQLVLGSGPDGADRALLQRVSDVEWVASHFDRVVLGSGDGIFADLLASLRRLGVAVGVVGPAGSISWKLRRYAHFVRTFNCEQDTRGVA
jgi:hypothetical protein